MLEILGDIIQNLEEARSETVLVYKSSRYALYTRKEDKYIKTLSPKTQFLVLDINQHLAAVVNCEHVTIFRSAQAGVPGIQGPPGLPGSPGEVLTALGYLWISGNSSQVLAPAGTSGCQVNFQSSILEGVTSPNSTSLKISTAGYYSATYSVNSYSTDLDSNFISFSLLKNGVPIPGSTNVVRPNNQSTIQSIAGATVTGNVIFSAQVGDIIQLANNNINPVVLDSSSGHDYPNPDGTASGSVTSGTILTLGPMNAQIGDLILVCVQCSQPNSVFSITDDSDNGYSPVVTANGVNLDNEIWGAFGVNVNNQLNIRITFNSEIGSATAQAVAYPNGIFLESYGSGTDVVITQRTIVGDSVQARNPGDLGLVSLAASPTTLLQAVNDSDLNLGLSNTDSLSGATFQQYLYYPGIYNVQAYATPSALDTECLALAISLVQVTDVESQEVGTPGNIASLDLVLLKET